MIVCIPVTSDGLTAPGWGRANRVALVSASDGEISDWQAFDVGWDALHDEGTEGAHHARIARFLIDHHIEVVVAEHMGSGMTRMLATMGIRTSLGAHGDARAVVLAALADQEDLA
ncbi:MAG TPA: NifB/NifX family molybdenum-iron cluster-binding protein [Nakamurella sp.]